MMRLRLLAIPLLAAVLGGCFLHEEAKTGAAESLAVDGRQMLNGDWHAVVSEAQRLTQTSSLEELSHARSQAVRVRDRLLVVRAPDELDRLRMTALEAQIARLDAAIEFTAIQSELDKQTQEALTLRANSRRSPEEMRALLRESDDAFATLEDQLRAAERNYRLGTNRVRDAIAQVKGLEPIPPQKD
jgi:hypothetical protein